MGVNYILNALKAVAIAVLTVAVLLFVLCLVSYSNDDPDKMLDAFGYIIFFAGAAVCGIAAGLQNNKSNKKSIVPGIISGVLYLVIVFAVSMLFSGENQDGGFIRKMICYLSALAVSALSGKIINFRSQKSGSRLSPGKLRKNTLKKITKSKI